LEVKERTEKKREDTVHPKLLTKENPIKLETRMIINLHLRRIVFRFKGRDKGKLGEKKTETRKKRKKPRPEKKERESTNGNNPKPKPKASSSEAGYR